MILIALEVLVDILLMIIGMMIDIMMTEDMIGTTPIQETDTTIGVEIGTTLTKNTTGAGIGIIITTGRGARDTTGAQDTNGVHMSDPRMTEGSVTTIADTITGIIGNIGNEIRTGETPMTIITGAEHTRGDTPAVTTMEGMILEETDIMTIIVPETLMMDTVQQAIYTEDRPRTLQHLLAKQTRRGPRTPLGANPAEVPILRYIQGATAFSTSRPLF